MLSNGGFSRFCNSTSFISTNTAAIFSPLLTTKSNLCHVLISSSVSSNRPFLQTQFNFCAVLEVRRNGFCVLASEKRRGSSHGVSEIEDFDYDDDDDEEEVEDGDDVGVILPVGNMKKWLENKPRGFGEGKMYDTSIEDKLFDEMLQSKQAQAANINKLKNNAVNSDSNENGVKKASEIVPSGFRVRVTNLPKKKNVHRDLKLAFDGVPGIINITPAVSGSKKTRDPICTGFAFVDFKSMEQANRFVQTFSRQSVVFGKIQKQIKCEMMNSGSNNSAQQQSDDKNTYILPRLTAHSLERDTNAESNTEDDFLDLSEESHVDEFDEPEDELEITNLEDIRENLESASVVELEPVTKDKTRENEKKLLAKGKAKKVPKLHIPGSAKRLKIKEKAVLTTLFSKYGGKSASASKEES